MFIQTEETPNPDVLKFLPGQKVVPGKTIDIRSRDEAEPSPLAQKLFDIKGVKSILNSKHKKLDDYKLDSLKADYYKKNINIKTKNLLEKIKKLKRYGKKNTH